MTDEPTAAEIAAAEAALDPDAASARAAAGSSDGNACGRLQSRRLQRWKRRRVFAAAAALAVVYALVLFLIQPPDRTRQAAAPVAPAPSPDFLPPTDQPSASASPSQPAPSSTAPPSPSTPPSRPADVQPRVTVAVNDAPADTDLTAEGTIDWMYWGLNDSRSVDRKRTGGGTIVDKGGPGARGRFSALPNVYSWRDGNPTATGDRASSGIYTCGVNNGFELAVPAGPTQRTLRLHAGVWQARGRLDVRLSTGGASTTTRLENRTDITKSRFTINFQAPPGSTLTVTWTGEAAFNRMCGSITLHAATLR